MRTKTQSNGQPRPFRTLELGGRGVVCETRDDGSYRLRSSEALQPAPRVLTSRIADGARAFPDRTMMAQRRGPAGAWLRLSYEEMHEKMLAVSQALLDRGLSVDRPLVILSGASLEHAILAYAAMHVGIPYAPISPAYSLLSADFRKLGHMMGLLTPGMVFCDDYARFTQAVASVVPDGCEVAAVTGAGGTVTGFDELAQTPVTEAVAAAHAAITSDTVAKILFTSGSTGLPKGVINTDGMLTSAQQMFAQAFPFVGRRPPVIVDWLPWHHTSGANQILGMVPYLGGTLYIDDGKPTAEGMATTVANLKEISPTTYFTVPKGLAELLPYLRADEAFARGFFDSVDFVFYSGAALSEPVLTAFDDLAMEHAGCRTPIMSAYGATETAPFALVANWPSEVTGLAGVPLPGVELKLEPVQGKLEACLKGPNVTPGYWRQPELTRQAFDAEGFLHFGDAMTFAGADASDGLRFDGRLSEDFKLSTGTWVNVGGLRTALLSEAGMMLHDAVICGEGRDDVGALLFLSPEACEPIARAALGSHEAASLHPAVLEHVKAVLDRLAAGATGSSTFVARAMLMSTAPSAAAGEITDKGSLNARAFLDNHRDGVAALYATSREGGVFVASAAQLANKPS